MKFVAIIDGKKNGADRITTFRYDEPGPLPPILHPEGEDKPKDTEPPKPETDPKESPA